MPAAKAPRGKGVDGQEDPSRRRPGNGGEGREQAFLQHHGLAHGAKQLPDPSHVARNGDILLRNPWGPGNEADQGIVIRLTPEQFNGHFISLAVAPGARPANDN
jgi:hypothetical protein